MAERRPSPPNGSLDNFTNRVRMVDMVHRLVELARLFLKLGTISFGGPAAHLAMMEHEVVERRKWIPRGQFLDLIGATHLIPGPNAVEMASHVGYQRAGVLGALVGGVAFTLPAVAITALFAWSYAQYGTLPQVEPLLQGIKPAILAVIFVAVWRLAKKALLGWKLVFIGVGVAVAVLLGVDEVVVLLTAAVIGLFFLRTAPPEDKGGKRPGGKGKTVASLVAVTTSAVANTLRAAPSATANATAVGAAGTGVAGAMGAGAGAAGASTLSLWKLGLFFAKVGAVMYGGGYVLVAYLEGGLVNPDWGLTQQELLDAVAVGQLTPGPMLTTATFVGYLLAGVPGAIVATVGIMLPSFVLVLAVNPIIPRLRESRWASRFLDAVNAASIGLMVAVSITLTRHTLVNWQSCLIAAVAVLVGLRWKITPAWLVLGGALVGWFIWAV